ncbi:hypothetical protein BTN82_24855 [Pseudomonas chlororaphis]|uniref:Uncharacterized protein n=1 Tax=Pseudomonas chlororaphis TaxID=587753 RepID=A0A1Q8EKF4_9PSED|nr:hypothetical protein BTN82_24855 [Pseudomonas chlororaphis]
MSAALGLMFVLLYLWTFNLVDYELEGASVESLTGTVRYVDSGGMLVQDDDSGEYTRLRMIRGISYFKSDKGRLQGRTLEFTRLRDAILTCALDGQELCVAQCSSAAQCLERRREREAPLGLPLAAFGISLVCLGLHRGRRRPSASGADSL